MQNVNSFRYAQTGKLCLALLPFIKKFDKHALLMSVYISIQILHMTASALDPLSVNLFANKKKKKKDAYQLARSY